MLLACQWSDFPNWGDTAATLAGTSLPSRFTGGNISEFGQRCSTVKLPNSNVAAGLTVIVFADMRCWVPALQAFVPPEQTTIASTLTLGSGS